MPQIEMKLTGDQRLRWLRVAAAAGTIASMALSYKLWLSSRFYPLTPVFSFLKPIPSPYDAILFGAAIAALILAAISRRWIAVFAVLGAVLAISDQSRLQPWFYEYYFLLLGAAFASPNACRVILAGTYFWSGAQKLNAGFINDVFPWMLEPVMKHLPRSAHALVHPLSLAAPFVEVWIGIALLGRKFRTPAIVAAIAMHLFILVAIGPWGQNYNYVVWPWNLAMIAFVVIMFWKTDERALDIIIAENWFHGLALILFAAAPSLSLFGVWDHYLSAAMYTNNRNRGTIYITDKLFDRLPDEIQEYVREETPDIDSIDIAEWSDGELHVPPYPEVRIYKNVARRICEYAKEPTEVRLSIMNKSTIGSKITGTSYTCAALK